jgi:hypothetical protein
MRPPEQAEKAGDTMYIPFVSLSARAIKRLLGRVNASMERNAHSDAIIARYTARRWCDSTERDLSDELMGRGGWWAGR